MTTMTPTDEQQHVLDLFAGGDQLVVEAGAGTGKTSTLRLLSASTPRRGQYLAFNRAIVDEARQKMPPNIAVSTAHSLAMQAHGRRYAHRLKSKRLSSRDIANRVGIVRAFGPIDVGGITRMLQPSYLAGLVMRSIGSFCQSADPAPTYRHVPYVEGIDDPVPDGRGGSRRGYTNNDALARFLEPAVIRAWDDLNDLNGLLRYDHGHYLKQWQLTEPTIPADFILVDEAQDLNPVMRAIVLGQHDAQVIWVGDSQQQIYGWNGAVNALASVDADRAFLTQSFRFGPAVAETANTVLEALDADLRIVGLPSIESTVGPVPDPDVILCRTNAAAVATCLAMQKAGRQVALVGGADEVVRFATAAAELQSDRRWTAHPELSCFDSWPAVQAYVEQDELGSELAMMVGLVDDYTPEVIIQALGETTQEAAADVTVSTAHKSKGREWNRVRLAGDFPDPTERSDSSEELRLTYVAATRAQLALDVSAVPFFFEPSPTTQEALR